MCWKHKMVPFQQSKKEIYIRIYVSASQYKSGENTDMYVRIVASWLHLIYILWVFYVRILSICHNLNDSSISGGLVPHNLFYYLKVNNHNRVGLRGNNAHWVNPYQFILAVWKAIILIESDIGTPSTIGLNHVFF